MKPGGWAGPLAGWLALFALWSGCGEEPPGPSGSRTGAAHTGSCIDDSSAPAKWRHPETGGLELSPVVVHSGDPFQARPSNPHRTTYGLHLIALDVAQPCSEIFYLDYESSGRTWERMPKSGSFIELSRVMEGRVIPAVVPTVATPGRYKVCSSENECGKLTVVP